MIKLHDIPQWAGVRRSVADPSGILDETNPGNALEELCMQTLLQLWHKVKTDYGVKIDSMDIHFAPGQNNLDKNG